MHLPQDDTMKDFIPTNFYFGTRSNGIITISCTADRFCRSRSASSLHCTIPLECIPIYYDMSGHKSPAIILSQYICRGFFSLYFTRVYYLLRPNSKGLYIRIYAHRVRNAYIYTLGFNKHNFETPTSPPRAKVPTIFWWGRTTRGRTRAYTSCIYATAVWPFITVRDSLFNACTHSGLYARGSACHSKLFSLTVQHYCRCRRGVLPEWFFFFTRSFSASLSRHFLARRRHRRST